MKNNKLLVLILVSVLIGLGLLRVGFDAQTEIEKLNDFSNLPSARRAQLVIEQGTTTIEQELKVQPGDTVFDLLNESGIKFSYKEYENGALVTSISGLPNTSKSWMYYVNGEMPSVAVNKKMVEGGDLIKFKYQRSPF